MRRRSSSFWIPNNIGIGTIGLGAIGVAEDGAIYACNVDTAGIWKLYRWADSGSRSVPTLSFCPVTPSCPAVARALRFGDEMSVRGSGINTEILIDNRNTCARVSLICGRSSCPPIRQ